MSRGSNIKPTHLTNVSEVYINSSLELAANHKITTMGSDKSTDGILTLPIKQENARNEDHELTISQNELPIGQESQVSLNELPNEIMSMIFSSMTFKERTSFEVVCSLWRMIILDIKDQRTIALTNTKVAQIDMEFARNCQMQHYPSGSADTVIVSNSTEISSVLKRCPRLTALYIGFDDDFVFSHRQLAQDLNKWCPFLEHFQWRMAGRKTQFLKELGDLKNLSCWIVKCSAQDSDNAIGSMRRQKKLQLKCLEFGKGINQILNRTDPTCLEQISVTIDDNEEDVEPVNIKRFHKLKEFNYSEMSYDNYLHLATLTKLRSFTSSEMEFLPQSVFKSIVENNRQIEDIHLNWPIDDQLIPLIAEYLPNLESIHVDPEDEDYYQEEDWLALSKLNNLKVLSLRRFSTSQPDMDGLKTVVQTCSSLSYLYLDHLQDADLPETEILEIQLVICGVVEACQPWGAPRFSQIIETSDEVNSCYLHWNKCNGS